MVCLQAVEQHRRLGLPDGSLAQLPLQLAGAYEQAGLRQDSAFMALQAHQLSQQHCLAVGLKERQVLSSLPS